MSTRRIHEFRDDRRPISAALARALDIAEARALARGANGLVMYKVRTSERELMTAAAAAGEIEVVC